MRHIVNISWENALVIYLMKQKTFLVSYGVSSKNIKGFLETVCIHGIKKFSFFRYFFKRNLRMRTLNVQPFSKTKWTWNIYCLLYTLWWNSSTRTIVFGWSRLRRDYTDNLFYRRWLMQDDCKISRTVVPGHQSPQRNFFRRWLEVSLMIGSIIFNGRKYHFSKFVIRGVSYGWSIIIICIVRLFVGYVVYPFSNFFFVAETKVYRKSTYLWKNKVFMFIDCRLSKYHIVRNCRGKKKLRILDK